MENEILFENVSFSYDGKEVFRNLNVRIPSDRHVALVGESHSLVAEKIRSSEKITNSELRKAIAAIRGSDQDQEG